MNVPFLLLQRSVTPIPLLEPELGNMETAFFFRVGHQSKRTEINLLFKTTLTNDTFQFTSCLH